MKTDHISLKESLYLIYAYVTISTFLLLVISKITENLGKALDFHPIVSLIIIINMGVFISLYYYKKRHNSHINHHHF
jgi:hypothetical protein